MDVCKDSLDQIEKESESIRQHSEEINRNFAQTEYICQSQNVSNRERDIESMKYALNNIEKQKRFIEITQNQVRKQLQQCDPELIRMPVIQDLVLKEYVKSTKGTLDEFKEPFQNRFNETVLTSLNTKNFSQILTNLSRYNKQDRVIMVKSKAQEDQNQDLDHLHSLLIYLNDCEGLLSQISKEIESAVFKYAEYLIEVEKRLNHVYQHLQVLQSVLNMSIVSYEEINQYQHTFEEIVSSTDNITEVLITQVKFPYNNNLEYNQKLFNDIEFEKNGLMKSLIEYNIYIRSILSKSVQMQQTEGLPFQIQTPMTFLIVRQSNIVERYKKRLENAEYVIKAFKSLQFTSVQAQQYEQQAIDWVKAHQTRYPTEQQLRDKIEELQGIIVKLIDMRDNLGLHHLKYSHEYLYKEVMVEYEIISAIIDRIQNIQIDLSRRLIPSNKADNNVAQAGQLQQKQVSTMNQMLTTGSFNALPVLQDKDDRIKRSRLSPNKYPNDVDRFNYEVTKTRHLLQQNAQRQIQY